MRQGIKSRITHIFSTHGFKHLLQLNSQLLDVVDQDAGLTRQQHTSHMLTITIQNTTPVYIRKNKKNLTDSLHFWSLTTFSMVT